LKGGRIVHDGHSVIVGAGISGLACARPLSDAGEHFTVVSPNIGGRIQQSADGAVPFGAFYVRADYEHVNRFVNRVGAGNAVVGV
jgi:predicted NAD/FAD-dependent oxidoreductase